MLYQLIEAMQKAIQEVKKWPQKTVHIFHHNDADGLSSGAIPTRAFERQGFEVQRFCLEKPYPRVLKKVYEKEERYILKSATGDTPYDELAIYLETLGAVGYYQRGPDMGVRVCLDGVSPESDRMVEKLNTLKAKIFEAEIHRLKTDELNESPHIQWLHEKNTAN